MPTYKFKGGVYQNVDEVAIDGLSPVLVNGYVDEFDVTCKRPGYGDYVSLGVTQPVKGIFYWQQKGCLLTVANGRIYKIDSAKVITDKTTNALTNVTNSAIFASDGGATWIATGGRMVLLDWNTSETNAIFVADTDAPTTVTHVTYLDGYVICNKVGSGQFFWTSPLDRASWNALDFASAESHPDTIIALHSFWRELYLFGQSTVEVWYNSGTPNFSRLGGGLIEVGCSAPYSVVRLSGTIFWMDNMRRFVRLNGRDAQSVSQPIQRQLDNLPFVADMVAYPISTRGRNWIILNFQSSNKTYCYDIDLNQWAEWGEWSSSLSIYNHFSGISSSVIDTSTGTTFLKSDGVCTNSSQDCSNGGQSWSDIEKLRDGISGHTLITNGVIGLSSSEKRSASNIVQYPPLQWMWTDPITNGLYTDFTYTGCGLPTGNESAKITYNNFSFSIPTDRSITNISVDIGGYCTMYGMKIKSVVLIKPDSSYSNHLGQGVYVYTGYGINTISATLSEWGITLTPEEANNSNFKAEVQFYNDSGQTSTMLVDFLSATIFYSTSPQNTKSCVLHTFQYGVTVPTGAILQGVVFSLLVPYKNGTISLVKMKLCVGGVEVGSNMADSFVFKDSQQLQTIGSPDNLWGYNLTKAHVETTSFGCLLELGFSGTCEMAIDECKVSVFYTLGTTPFSMNTGILIGHKSDGKIYEIKNDSFKDSTIPIRLERRTGSITYNTLKTKRCKKLSMRFKRGLGNVETPNPSFKLRHRTDMKNWSHVETIDMGGQVDTYGFQDLHRLGIYKSRQYEIVHEQATDFVFVEGEEESEVLLT